MDLPLQDLALPDPTSPSVKDNLMSRICAVISKYYGCPKESLRPRTWKESHLLKYR